VRPLARRGSLLEGGGVGLPRRAAALSDRLPHALHDLALKVHPLLLPLLERPSHLSVTLYLRQLLTLFGRLLLLQL
jgi:hypothetical protein